MDLNARIARQISQDISARPEQVTAAVTLLDEGATVPFVARYRKEVTGGLDDTQLRKLSDRLIYLRELEARRQTIIKAIDEQGKLTASVSGAISGAQTKAELEDIYLPYKKKRRTKAMIARENGLEPLAQAILNNRHSTPQDLAKSYLNAAVPGVKEALNGARDIIAESLAEDADLLRKLRDWLRKDGVITSTLVAGKAETGAKFSDYFDHAEPVAKVRSHRFLAMLRASNEGIVTVNIGPRDAEKERGQQMVAAALQVRGQGAADDWLRDVAGWTWRVKLSLSMTLDLLSELRTQAQEEAIDVFARNLRDLLLAAPAGARNTLGLDPGIRTGVKLAAIDATGKVLETNTIYPFPPKKDVRGAQVVLSEMIQRHKIQLVAVGNGTGSRETERLVGDVIKALPEGTAMPTKVIVSEAGASVYSASELAAQEFPDLDVSLRGAVSIARRLQDPLAELVKIDPKSIGVGQYQHDVDQHRLGRSLQAVVEDAVNAVGVDLNTASKALLSYVSGLGPSLAEAIVTYRDHHGAFSGRKALLDVPRLGPRAFEQSAGFLRILDGSEPLDQSAVHPEAYGIARDIIRACGRDLREIMGKADALSNLRAEDFVRADFGLPTVRDILKELEKPGRDPRPAFKTAAFADGIEDIRDLKPGQKLEGTVSNVAAFGAFVDIGVHQDGLVHVSQLADRFVKDPHEVVKAGDVVRVTVTEVDVTRKRIALSMRTDASTNAVSPDASKSSSAKPKVSGSEARNRRGEASGTTGQPPKHPKRSPSVETKEQGALGVALREAMKRT
ncbi:RNA-binding transcriptional accessory protein [Rhodobacteraceae bacterium]|nr:RNA-binding transcriptional accessory protein [Paracoccaceae bacterium]